MRRRRSDPRGRFAHRPSTRFERRFAHRPSTRPQPRARRSRGRPRASRRALPLHRRGELAPDGLLPRLRRRRRWGLGAVNVAGDGRAAAAGTPAQKRPRRRRRTGRGGNGRGPHGRGPREPVRPRRSLVFRVTVARRRRGRLVAITPWRRLRRSRRGARDRERRSGRRRRRGWTGGSVASASSAARRVERPMGCFGSFERFAAGELLGDGVSFRERCLQQLPPPARDDRAVPVVEDLELRLYRAFPRGYLEDLTSGWRHRVLFLLRPFLRLCLFFLLFLLGLFLLGLLSATRRRGSFDVVVVLDGAHDRLLDGTDEGLGYGRQYVVQGILPRRGVRPGHRRGRRPG